MNSNSSAIIIPPPAPAGIATTNDIRGIKPPLEIPDGWVWLWWTLGAVALITAAVLAWRWWRRKQVELPPVPVVPAHVRAKQKLQAALSLISDPKLFCTQVSEALRVYLEERFNFHAPDRTTEEFLLELQATTLLTPAQKQSLGEFLQSCDLVKFARFEPTESALRELHDAALRLVDETQHEAISTPAPTEDTPATPPAPALPSR